MIILMFLMVCLTFIVGGFTLAQRVRSVKQRALKMSYFKLMQGESLPDKVVQTTRCFNNQFEVPLLFYVACVLLVALNWEGGLSLSAGVVFVVSRYIHAFIHLTYNNVIHRMLAFWVGCMAIAVIWINVLVVSVQAGWV